MRQHAAQLPIIALDAIRVELDIAPTEHSGRVVLAAKRRARELLQQRQPFVWNATNITRLLRRELIDFFVGCQRLSRKRDSLRLSPNACASDRTR